ncbi:hypothetical protein F5B22DRAFT_623653 [Xylaria bambusicola]|uniref:uncharacterized protein n=1 Tax=Xylaria bambusicola TaxID=326684 RepID=UPI002008D576|nr:uncharacterized protein F5B22DRAFT_623653 [Xylaria bambusicola]KAI0506452.1 hypothetical protein F5B22DRAFT_623653 [Xylaria bambusicola]
MRNDYREKKRKESSRLGLLLVRMLLVLLEVYIQYWEYPTYRSLVKELNPELWRGNSLSSETEPAIGSLGEYLIFGVGIAIIPPRIVIAYYTGT